MNLAGKNACLNCGTDGYAFVRVDTLERFFSGYFLNCFLNSRDSCGTADQDNLCKVSSCNSCVLHRLVHRFDGSLYKVFRELVEFCSCDVFVHVERTVSRYGDERKIDIRGLGTGKLFLCLFCGFL